MADEAIQIEETPESQSPDEAVQMDFPQLAPASTDLSMMGSTMSTDVDADAEGADLSMGGTTTDAENGRHIRHIRHRGANWGRHMEMGSPYQPPGANWYGPQAEATAPEEAFADKEAEEQEEEEEQEEVEEVDEEPTPTAAQVHRRRDPPPLPATSGHFALQAEAAAWPTRPAGSSQDPAPRPLLPATAKGASKSLQTVGENAAEATAHEGSLWDARLEVRRRRDEEDRERTGGQRTGGGLGKAGWGEESCAAVGGEGVCLCVCVCVCVFVCVCAGMACSMAC